MKTPAFIAAFFIFLQIGHLHAQTTGFTFQGSLRNGTVAADGDHDFEFRLFDSLAGGTQIGSTIAVNDVAVSDGVFSVRLNFGSQFPGAVRFLEIRVRPSGQPGFTVLSPRQLINSAPYAVKSLNSETADNAANAAQLGGVAASQYVITTDSRMTDARDPLPGSANYIQNANTQQAASNFNISGNGTVGGTLGGNIVRASTQFNLGGQRILGNGGGGNNLFVGIGAGNSNTHGDVNTFVGQAAGNANTTGTGNAFFGALAGWLNATGIDNSFFGTAAGRSNTSANSNSFFGSGAGVVNTASGNAFFGAFAGTANTSGFRNSFVGAFAGNSNTTGSENSFFGRSAGSANTTGSNNSFIGSSAGIANTLGFDNSFFGSHAGDSNTTGSTNSFFGATAGASNTTGAENSFFGRHAGLLNTTGDNNSFFGRSAGSGNTAASFNSIFGAYAGSANGGSSTGGSNSFFGYNTGHANTTGSENAFFGMGAGQANTTGNDNSFFGMGSGNANTTGFFNTFIGRAAGNANTTGDNNTAIGRGADVGSGNLSFATAIGAQAVVSSSNTIQLGRENGSDVVRIPGRLRVFDLSLGITPLCHLFNEIATCSSSIRYKTDIQPFVSGLDLLNRLRPVAFTWKEAQIPDFGLIAEEAAEAEPLLVTHNNKGEIEGVKYDRVGIVLINAVREQQEQIESLQRKLEIQSEIIRDLKKIVYSQAPDAKTCGPEE